MYIDAAYKKSPGKYMYVSIQSKDQGEVNALDDFFQSARTDAEMMRWSTTVVHLDLHVHV